MDNSPVGDGKEQPKENQDPQPPNEMKQPDETFSQSSMKHSQVAVIYNTGDKDGVLGDDDDDNDDDQDDDDDEDDDENDKNEKKDEKNIGNEDPDKKEENMTMEQDKEIERDISKIDFQDSLPARFPLGSLDPPESAEAEAVAAAAAFAGLAPSDPDLKHSKPKDDKKDLQGDDLYFDNVNYKQNWGFFGLLFFFNLLTMARQFKKVIRLGQSLKLQHIFQLDDKEKVEAQTDTFYESIDSMRRQDIRVTPFFAFKSILKCYKMDICCSLIIGVFEILSQFTCSYSLYKCISALEGPENKVTRWPSQAWAGVMVGALLLQTICRHWSWMLGINFNSKFRMMLVNTIFKKINRLSSFAIREANIGKVINLISSDLNSTENKFSFLFLMALSPIVLLISGYFLYDRIGIPGPISIVLLLAVFPIQRCMGSLQGKHFLTRSQKSDERIKLIDQSISGIRLIKMYGWEEAFRVMVEKIRNEELEAAKRGQYLNYIEKGISLSSVLLVSSIAFFLTIIFRTTLTTAMIFSTLEILSYTKINVMVYSGMGIGYIYEFRIFLERYLDIFYIKEGEMIGAEPMQPEGFSQLGPDDSILLDGFNAYWQTKKQVKRKSQSQLTVHIEHSLEVGGNFTELTETKRSQKLNEEPKGEWRDSSRPVLKNISLTVKRGELLAVVGKIGSGKTTLLQALLQEIPYFEGHFEIRPMIQEGVNGVESELNRKYNGMIERIRTVDITSAAKNEGVKLKFIDNPSNQIEKQHIAYVEQEPFVFQSTVRENILFGKNYNKRWYKEVVKCCCLQDDLKNMENGDLTEIAANGSNISGGQKARICLARAVYSNADIYLLDGPLSAIDSKLSKKIFRRCIQGVLKGKTIILVTHHIHFAIHCDRVLVLEAGLIKQLGKFEDIEDDLKQIAAGALKFEVQSQDNQENNEELSRAISKVLEAREKEVKQKGNGADSSKAAKKLASDEFNEVSFSTYKRFSSIISTKMYGFPVGLLLLFLFAEILFALFGYFLRQFQSGTYQPYVLASIWVSIATLYLLVNIAKYIYLSRGVLNGSEIIHNQMYKSVTRAPTSFFDLTSNGTLLNTFSNDMNIVDTILHFSANDSLDILMNFMNLMINICIISPFVSISGLLEIILLLAFLRYNKEIILNAKKIDLENKTPVYSFFQTALLGIIPIKIHGQKCAFLSKMEVLCNNSIRTNLAFWNCNRFFGVFVQYISVISSSIGVFVTIYLGSSDKDQMAQSIVYLIMMTDSIQWCLRQTINVDSVMSSIERAYQFMDIPSEASLVTQYDIDNQYNLSKSSSNAIQRWPLSGDLSFNKVYMRYHKELDPTLKGLSFEIPSGKKVGCVGRTGAGKSSILQALFRMSESEEGSLINYDGVDISKLGLHTLRTRISIIPQVPFVFAGTIRKNIDPLSIYTDEQIWESLKLVELDDFIRSRYKDGLETDMSDVTSVFSMGQRQLICLTRVVLQSNKLLVLDEATANVDMETDNLIQSTIRSKFSESSILTIAHRLNTIANYDVVLVLDKGQVAEFEHPFLLLVNSVNDTTITRNSIFAEMVNQTGKNNSKNIFEIARQAFFSSQKVKHILEDGDDSSINNFK